MLDDFGVNNAGATPGFDGTEKAADGAPTVKRPCMGGGAGRYCAAFEWRLIPNGNILGKLGGGPATFNLWLKSDDTNEGGGIGIVGNRSGILLSALKK